MDLTAQLEAHERTGARATLALVRVEDPSAYGLVHVGDGGEVTEFLEKPGDRPVDIDTISAGAYVLEREVLGMLERGARASIEREVFPRLVGHGLHAVVHTAYWLDIGTPERYLEASFDILEGTVRTPVAERVGPGGIAVAEGVHDAGRVVAPALVAAGCTIGEGARVGGRSVLGEGVAVGARAHVEDAVVLDGARIGADCVIRNCIIAPGAGIGDGTHVEGGAMVGADARVGAHNQLTRGMKLFPGVTLPDGAVRFG
jgi:mannose-1-phosphate guanylyltransferase